MRTESVPVLVVGGGPVGLSTAMFLSHWGVRPLLVDKRDPLSAPPRAGSSLRTLELFRAVGLGAELERHGWRGGPPMRGVFRTSALGPELHRAELPGRYADWLERASPVDTRLTLTEDVVQRLALGAMRRWGGEARFGARLVGLRQDARGVRAEVVDAATGERWGITAEYLIAADGARSTVRAGLGVPVPDREVVARLHTAFYRADLGPITERWGTHMCFVRNDGVYATLISKNGRDQWTSHIMDFPGKPDELTELSAPRTLELLRAAIGDPTVPVELLEVNAWEAALGMASSFREGRVFLVGDAAHVQSSAGGLGMNTGIQDGHNLAWRIAAVLHGQASPALLDGYDPERRAAARASLALSRGMHEGYLSPAGDPNDLYARMAADYLRGMIGYGYHADGACGCDALDDTVRTGHRFPHRVTGDGTSTLDLIGSRWTLFAAADEGHWRHEAAALDIAPRVHLLGDPRDGSRDGSRGDPFRGAGGAALVRPDGFVAWYGDTGASLRHAVHRLLG